LKNKYSTLSLLYILGGIVLLVTVIFRLRLVHLPIDRDEGEFAYAGWRMMHGGVPYLDYYNMKMPGIYAAYALLFLVFGSTVEAIRIGLLLVNLANTFFVFRIAENAGSRRTGIYAALCYLVFSMQVELQGTCAHAEHFAMLFTLSGLLVFTGAVRKKSLHGLFACGCLFGLAFLMKQPAFSFMLMASLLLLLESRHSKWGWKYFFKSAIALATGAAFPVLVTAVILIVAGAGAGFRLFAFDYAREYISYLGFRDGWHNFCAALADAIRPNVFMWMLVPLSFLLMPFQAQRKNNTGQVIFFMFSFIAVSAGFYFRPHYFQFLLPAAALLCATALSATEARWKQMHFIPVLFLLAAVSFFVYRERSLITTSKDEDFIRKIYHLDFFNATKKAADFIAENSQPGARVAIFGAEPEVWFYSKRLAASGYLYVYPLLENQKFAPAMRQQFYTETVHSKPDILLYTSNEGTWYANGDVRREMYEWCKAYCDSSFKRIALIDMPFDGPTSYYWTEDTALHPLNAENYIEIYKRK
jgi:hypothetical protein